MSMKRSDKRIDSDIRIKGSSNPKIVSSLLGSESSYIDNQKKDLSIPKEKKVLEAIPTLGKRVKPGMKGMRVELDKKGMKVVPDRMVALGGKGKMASPKGCKQAVQVQELAYLVQELGLVLVALDVESHVELAKVAPHEALEAQHEVLVKEAPREVSA